MADEPHIHCAFFGPILDTSIDAVGAERTREVLADLGTTEAQLRDRNGWISRERTETVLEALIEASGDSGLVLTASRRLFTGSYLGVLKPVLQFFGSPGAMFTQFPTSSGRWDKSGHWELHAQGPDFVDMSYISQMEGSEYMCIGRVAQLGGMPTLFGIPPATVEHAECLHRGDDGCRYHIRWEAPQSSRWDAVPWVLCGVAALGAAAWLSGAAAWGSLPIAVIGGGVGWLGARAVRQANQMTALGQRLMEQDRALHTTLQANEARYTELLEAKRGVDQQVAVRTEELQKTSDQLSLALADVRQLDEQKTKFFANVSHELRTPLQLILGPLDEMRRERGLPDAVRRSLDVMSHNADRLYRLINQLLDLASADAGRAELARVAMSVEGLLDPIVEAFSVAADQKQVVLRTEADAVVALLDPHWIESAVTNLVANALRHCEAGDCVDVRATVEDDTLVLEVADTGPGIPEADRARIFDRFAQSTQKEGGARGTGLGLAIVFEAAQLHGGVASVMSEVGVGTTFRLAMPFIAGVAPAPRQRRANPVPQVRTATDAAVTHVEGPTPHAPVAVVAEDEPDLRAYVAATLATRFRVIACANGQEAWREVQRTVPDLVVSDRTMPIMTGTELCAEIRADTATMRVPVILLTAHHTPEDVVRGYDAGADDYVIKPFHPRELMARAEAQLRLRRMTQEAVVRERMASIGMLSAEIAHHFRNPLNFIKSSLPVVRSKVDASWLESHGRFWDTLVESSSRIELLTCDLLRLARGHETAVDEIFNPADSIRSAVRLVDATLPPDTSLVLDEAQDARIRGRSGDLNQVLLNLLDNAGRALVAGGTIRVRATHPDEATYAIVVEDSGPGVPEELREHLFEAFVSTRAHGEGSGLGLAIAAKVVEDHGGTIEIETSEDLGGACFRITLPLVSESAVAPV